MLISGTRALVLVFALGISMPAFADTKDGAAEKPVEDKKICRSVESTGSVMVHRTCRTKSEWALIDEQHAKDAQFFGARTQNDQGGNRPQ